VHPTGRVSVGPSADATVTVTVTVIGERGGRLARGHGARVPAAGGNGSPARVEIKTNGGVLGGIRG
jgi:hypothetical protein